MGNLSTGYKFSAIDWTITGSLSKSLIELSVSPSSGGCSINDTGDSVVSFSLDKAVDSDAVNPANYQLNWGSFNIDLSMDGNSNLSISITSASSKRVGIDISKIDSGYVISGSI